MKTITVSLPKADYVYLLDHIASNRRAAEIFFPALLGPEKAAVVLWLMSQNVSSAAEARAALSGITDPHFTSDALSQAESLLSGGAA